MPRHALQEWRRANPRHRSQLRPAAVPARHIGPADPDVVEALQQIIEDTTVPDPAPAPAEGLILAAIQEITTQNEQRQQIAAAFGVPIAMLGHRVEGAEVEARAERERRRQKAERDQEKEWDRKAKHPYFYAVDPGWAANANQWNAATATATAGNYVWGGNNAYTWGWNTNITTNTANTWIMPQTYTGTGYGNAFNNVYLNQWAAPARVDWCEFRVAVSVADELVTQAPHFDLEALLTQRLEHEVRRAVPLPGGALARYRVMERRDERRFAAGITEYRYVLQVALEDVMAYREPVDLTAFCDALERVVQAAEWARHDREFAVRGRLIARAEMRERKRLERERLAAAERARVEAERARAAAAAERARVAEERRLAEIERLRNKAAIDAKAMKLLQDVLHPEEFAEYAAKKQVVIESKRHAGRGYIIRPGWRRIALCHRDQQGAWVEDTTQSLCIHPQDERLPEGDTVASLVLLTRFSEDEMLRVAIKHGYAA